MNLSELDRFLILWLLVGNICDTVQLSSPQISPQSWTVTKNCERKKREKPSRFQQGIIKFKQQKCGAFITGVHCCCTTLMCGWFASRKGKNKCHWNGNRWGRWNPRQNSHFSAPQLYEIYGAAIMNHRTDRASLMIPGITLLGCAVFLVEVGGRKGLVPFRLLWASQTNSVLISD